MGGGLADVLLRATLGFLFACVAIVLAIHGFATRHPRRAFNASAIAQVLSVLSVLLSLQIWTVLFSGQGPGGAQLDYGEESPAIVIVALEAIAVLASIAIAAREGLRRLS